jgi:hypothetical protein
MKRLMLKLRAEFAWLDSPDLNQRGWNPSPMLQLILDIAATIACECREIRRETLPDDSGLGAEQVESKQQTLLVGA